MLSDPLRNFRQRVAEASLRLGRNAGKIVDDILDESFPETCAAARGEGADNLLRKGAVAWVREALGAGEPEDSEQLDFALICGDFAGEVKALSKGAYFVPSLDVFVPVARLIAEPALLDEARRFTREKGQQTLAEADRLDALYEAVMAKIGLVA